jgi:hypothetical protein
MSDSLELAQAPGVPAWQQHEVLVSESWKPTQAPVVPAW